MTRYLQASVKGGVTALCTSQSYCPASALLPHRERLKIHFQAHPPHTVAQAAHAIEKLTGIKLALSACRDFIRQRLGMKCRKMAAIPSKADPDTGHLNPCWKRKNKAGAASFLSMPHTL